MDALRLIDDSTDGVGKTRSLGLSGADNDNVPAFYDLFVRHLIYSVLDT